MTFSAKPPPIRFAPSLFEKTHGSMSELIRNSQKAKFLTPEEGGNVSPPRARVMRLGVPRILLRRSQGLYLQPSGRWTNNRETAQEFETSFQAFSLAQGENWLHSEVVLTFGDPRYDLISVWAA